MTRILLISQPPPGGYPPTPSGYWRQRGGQVIAICEMGDRHLLNTLFLLKRKAVERDCEYWPELLELYPKWNELLTEAKRRKLDHSSLLIDAPGRDTTVRLPSEIVAEERTVEERTEHVRVAPSTILANEERAVATMSVKQIKQRALELYRRTSPTRCCENPTLQAALEDDLVTVVCISCGMEGLRQEVGSVVEEVRRYLSLNGLRSEQQTGKSDTESEEKVSYIEPLLPDGSTRTASRRRATSKSTKSVELRKEETSQPDSRDDALDRFSNLLLDSEDKK